MSYYEHIPVIQQNHRDHDTVGGFVGLLESKIVYEPSTAALVYRLCQALEAEGISYCHWKSNNALDRSASGENDLDLLVSRADIPRFTEILYRLEFKQVKAPSRKEMPGVLDFFGHDTEMDRLIHVHAHYQLILGHDMTKNYRLPIERPFLASAVQRNLFRVPEPEFEYVVFVIRMILKHSTWETILGREGRLKPAERKELPYLQARIDQARVQDILARHLPHIGVELFDDCVRALQPACSAWRRAKTGHRLQTRLQANARHGMLVDGYLKLWRRVSMAFRRRVLKARSKYRPMSGGAMIALVGGDGAGKSTAVEALYDWLSEEFEVMRLHIGKPAWSWTTIAVRGCLKIGNLLGLYPVESSMAETLEQESLVSPGYPWLMRQVCMARDRYWLYRKAGRFAANGGFAIVDRYPHPQIQLMDGARAERFVRELMDRPQGERFLSPNGSSRLSRALVKREKRYYDQIVPPELLIVLRVDPEIAVQRKTEEDADFVRERNSEIWELDWDGTGAYVIDGGKGITDVLTELKALVWSEL